VSTTRTASLSSCTPDHPSAVDLLWQGAGPAWRSSRGLGAGRRAARGRQKLLGGDEGDATIWDESRNAQALSLGRISFPPRGLAQTLALFPEALVRPGLGSA
jgi:hypothetical protein